MTELRSLVADDKARQTEWLRKRDEARRGSSIQDVKAGRVELVSTEELVAGADVTPDGDLAPCVSNYRVVGWKTNSEKEMGTSRECPDSRSAARAVGALLAEGCYQIIVESPVNRPPPIF